jgi:hypothetical protein
VADCTARDIALEIAMVQEAVPFNIAFLRRPLVRIGMVAPETHGFLLEGSFVTLPATALAIAVDIEFGLDAPFSSMLGAAP